MREARDAELGMPDLIIPSLQVNMRAGLMPPKNAAGRLLFKVPINAFADGPAPDLPHGRYGQRAVSTPDPALPTGWPDRRG